MSGMIVSAWVLSVTWSEAPESTPMLIASPAFFPNIMSTGVSRRGTYDEMN